MSKGITWEDVVRRVDAFIGGQAEIEGFQHEGMLRGEISGIAVEDDRLRLQFSWCAFRLGQEGWAFCVPQDNKPFGSQSWSVLMDPSVMPVYERDGSGTIEWSLVGMVSGRIFPKGHAGLLSTSDIHGFPNPFVIAEALPEAPPA